MFNTTKAGYDLDYLFIAETYSGNIIKQDPTDKPRFSDSGTIFTDVLNEHIKRFTLQGKGHLFTIDLTDGHAEIDGRTIYPPKAPPAFPLQLIYYRTVQRGMDVTYKLRINKNPLNKIIDTVIHPDNKPDVRYFIGWQVNFQGKNYKWEIGIQ